MMGVLLEDPVLRRACLCDGPLSGLSRSVLIQFSTLQVFRTMGETLGGRRRRKRRRQGDKG